MRSLITSAAASLAVLFALGPVNAMPVDHTMPAAVPDNIEQAQYVFGGRNYCWYDDGWRGPGYYWCGYAWRRGYGWGGERGWRGWGHGGPGPMVGRPGPGRGPVGRPGPGPGGRPGMVGRPGGPGAGAYVRPGGGRPAGGRPAPHH